MIQYREIKTDKYMPGKGKKKKEELLIVLVHHSNDVVNRLWTANSKEEL